MRECAIRVPTTALGYASAVAEGTLGGVQLPVVPPLAPMLAKSVKDVTTVPTPTSVDGGLLYEPKWDVSGETLTP